MKIEVFNYKKWIHDGICMPHVAACLIKGKDPDKCLAQEEADSGYSERSKAQIPYITMEEPELQELVELLCEGGFNWWDHNKTIFEHVNKAVKNSIKIDETLLSEIRICISNYNDADKNSFITTYPYLTNKLNLKISILSMQEETPSPIALQESERATLLKMVIGMAIDAYGYRPGASRNEATGSKKGSISYILNAMGLHISDDTVRGYLTEAATLFPGTKRHKP